MSWVSDEIEKCYKIGATVEVCLEDDGFIGSWYTGTIIPGKKKSGSKKKKTKIDSKYKYCRGNKIYVKFHTLMNDDTGVKPLKEKVDIVLVRPVPPRETTRTFKINEDVDAFQNDGWWEGIVTQVILPETDGGDGGGGKTKYKLYFRSSREEIVFEEADLRLHREWVYGKWVPPLEDPEQQEEDPLEPHTPSPIP